MGVLDNIKARLDIVDIVSDHVQLKKSGRNFKCVCPFHSEKTPSFIVNPERQSWHCFGACSTGGDIFSFIMRIEKLEFGEALRILARRAGVSLERKDTQGRSDALYQVNEIAASFYHRILESPAGGDARKYLDERGVNDEMRETFKLGLSPNGGETLKSHLGDHGLSLDIGVEAGLIQKAEEDHTRDFFWGRVMFPISDRGGHIIGFGGRIMSDGQPKYLNTPATSIFDKRATLYALNFAADSIRDRDTGVIVEGYMDAIAAHQYGFTNVVASMGTALTESQVGLLKSLAHNFVLALDPDAAGRMATDRGLLEVWEPMLRAVTRVHPKVGRLHTRAPIKLSIASLPQGKDPDDIIRNNRDQWKELTEKSVPLMDYLIPAVAQRHDIDTDEGKAAVVQTLGPLITAPENPFEQARYRDQLAGVLNISPGMLSPIIQQIQQMTNVRRERVYQNRQRSVRSTPITISDRAVDLEDYALSLIFDRPELLEYDWVQQFASQFFHKSENREVFAACLTNREPSSIKNSLDPSLHTFLNELTDIKLESSDRKESEAALSQCLWRLEVRHWQELQDGLLSDFAVSETPAKELEAAITPVNTRLKELFAQRA